MGFRFRKRIHLAKGLLGCRQVFVTNSRTASRSTFQQVLEGALRSALERLSKRGNHSFKFMIGQRVSAYGLA
jgi:hypothetical protein